MSRSAGFLSEIVGGYLSEHATESDVLKALRAETSQLSGSGMQIGADQGHFIALLVGLMGAKRTLEIGVYTGYSSICTATALGPNGHLLACDSSDEWTTVAKKYWKLAGVNERIELRLGAAQDTLNQLLADGRQHDFDFVFIDADKQGYDAYYEACLKLVRPGGLLMFDNALWGGSVADLTDTRADTVALRQLNRKVIDDPRVTASLVPIGDGLLLARPLP